MVGPILLACPRLHSSCRSMRWRGCDCQIQRHPWVCAPTLDDCALSLPFLFKDYLHTKCNRVLFHYPLVCTVKNIRIQGHCRSSMCTLAAHPQGPNQIFAGDPVWCKGDIYHVIIPPSKGLQNDPSSRPGSTRNKEVVFSLDSRSPDEDIHWSLLNVSTHFPNCHAYCTLFLGKNQSMISSRIN